MSCDNGHLVDQAQSRRNVDLLEINSFHRLGVRKSPKIELTPRRPTPRGCVGAGVFYAKWSIYRVNPSAFRHFREPQPRSGISGHLNDVRQRTDAVCNRPHTQSVVISTPFTRSLDRRLYLLPRRRRGMRMCRRWNITLRRPSTLTSGRPVHSESREHLRQIHGIVVRQRRER